MTLNEQYSKALQIAAEAHKGQSSLDGQEYIQHLLRVANKLDRIDEKIIALLLDTLSKTYVTPEYLEKNGIDVEIIRKVLRLTMYEDCHDFDEYITEVANDHLTRKVMMISLADELDIIEKLNVERYKEKIDNYKWALEFLKRAETLTHRFILHLILKNGNAIVSTEGASFMIDRSDRNILGDVFRSIRSFAPWENASMERYFVVESLKTDSLPTLHLKGLVNENGEYVVPVEYKDIRLTFFDGTFLVESANGSGQSFIRNGELHQQWYTKIDGFGFNTEGYATPLFNNRKYGLINLRGEILIQPIYDELSNPSCGLCAAAKRIDGKNFYGYLDLNGKEVIPFKYEHACPFKYGFAYVKEYGKEKWTIIDICNNIIVEDRELKYRHSLNEPAMEDEIPLIGGEQKDPISIDESLNLKISFDEYERNSIDK